MRRARRRLCCKRRDKTRSQRRFRCLGATPRAPRQRATPHVSRPLAVVAQHLTPPSCAPQVEGSRGAPRLPGSGSRDVRARVMQPRRPRQPRGSAQAILSTSRRGRCLPVAVAGDEKSPGGFRLRASTPDACGPTLSCGGVPWAAARYTARQLGLVRTESLRSPARLGVRNAIERDVIDGFRHHEFGETEYRHAVTGIVTTFAHEGAP